MKKYLPRSSNSSSAFTLIELMVVMAVIAVLSTMALYGLGKAQAAARDAQRQQIMTGVQTGLERYYSDNQAYPAGNFCTMISTLVTGSYLTSPTDPTKVPVCGTGTVGTAIYQYGSPVSGQCAGTALPNGYQLTLTKESGGRNYFCSPN